MVAAAKQAAVNPAILNPIPARHITCVSNRERRCCTGEPHGIARLTNVENGSAAKKFSRTVSAADLKFAGRFSHNARRPRQSAV
jgi:hypothetical protein